MTEQQAQSPIDDLFRKTFEDLPDTPAQSGWDTPSDRVWQHVQANIASPKKGWGVQQFMLLSTCVVLVSAGLYFLLARKATPPASKQSELPVLVTPSNTAPVEKVEEQPISTPKVVTQKPNVKDTQAKVTHIPHPSMSAPKPGGNTAQPLPGSKTTLPPNTTEGGKQNVSGQVPEEH